MLVCQIQFIKFNQNSIFKDFNLLGWNTDNNLSSHSSWANTWVTGWSWNCVLSWIWLVDDTGNKLWYQFQYSKIISGLIMILTIELCLMSLENCIIWRLLSYKGDWGNDWLEVVENVNLAICFCCIEIIKLWYFCWYDIYMFWLDLIINWWWNQYEDPLIFTLTVYFEQYCIK